MLTATIVLSLTIASENTITLLTPSKFQGIIETQPKNDITKSPIPRDFNPRPSFLSRLPLAVAAETGPGAVGGFVLGDVPTQHHGATTKKPDGFTYDHVY
ncbi:MAG: hypothetical protein ACR2RF_09540 [Geminicoccaceae bacterium]